MLLLSPPRPKSSQHYSQAGCESDRFCGFERTLPGDPGGVSAFSARFFEFGRRVGSLWLPRGHPEWGCRWGHQATKWGQRLSISIALCLSLEPLSGL